MGTVCWSFVLKRKNNNKDIKLAYIKLINKNNELRNKIGQITSLTERKFQIITGKQKAEMILTTMIVDAKNALQEKKSLINIQRSRFLSSEKKVMKKINEQNIHINSLKLQIQELSNAKKAIGSELTSIKSVQDAK